MENQSNLEIVVSAKDEASAALKNIGASVESADLSFRSLAASVGVGQAAFNLLQSIGSSVLGFFEESIDAAQKMSGIIAILNQNIKNQGLSIAEIGPKLEAYSQEMQKLGFDNDSTDASMSKLITITGKYGDALRLNQLAMDLARGTATDLSTATSLIAQVMQGMGGRALVQYGINIKDTASTFEILSAIQQKFGGDAQAYASSAAGQADQMKLAYEDVKREVGEALIPIQMEWFQIIKDNMPGIQKLVDGFKGTVETISGALQYIFGVDKGKKQYQDYLADLKKKYEDIAPPVSSLSDITSKLTTSALSHAKAIETMSSDYTKFKDTASIALAELSDSYQGEMRSIGDSIRQVEQEQKNLKDSFNRQAVSDAASIADKVIASEQKVKDLKIQVANEVDTMKKSQLQSQLNDEQKNYDSTLEFRRNNAQAITEAQRRAGLTQLQRDVEDYTSRRTLATQEYQQKMADLDNVWAAEQEKKKDAIALYTARKTEITDILNQGNADFLRLSDDRVTMTKNEVDSEIKYFQTLASAISQIKGASKSAVSLTGVSPSPRAGGGPVSPYAPYIVGEMGPELFVPTSAGTIVPNGKSSSTGDININISNLFGTDKTAAVKFANLVAGEIGKNLKLRTI